MERIAMESRWSLGVESRGQEAVKQSTNAAGKLEYGLSAAKKTGSEESWSGTLDWSGAECGS